MIVILTVLNSVVISHATLNQIQQVLQRLTALTGLNGLTTNNGQFQVNGQLVNNNGGQPGSQTFQRQIAGGGLLPGLGGTVPGIGGGFPSVNGLPGIGGLLPNLPGIGGGFPGLGGLPGFGGLPGLPPGMTVTGDGCLCPLPKATTKYIAIEVPKVVFEKPKHKHRVTTCKQTIEVVPDTYVKEVSGGGYGKPKGGGKRGSSTGYGEEMTGGYDDDSTSMKEYGGGTAGGYDDELSIPKEFGGGQSLTGGYEEAMSMPKEQSGVGASSKNAKGAPSAYSEDDYESDEYATAEKEEYKSATTGIRLRGR
ncbi:hypothetical protein HDE_14478 [Halotydeus destructor]|nr:hypothetical protein HDE_14478 [Halotydeus destructor]